MNRSGFTLVEALTALMVFALIAAAGTGLVATTLDARTAVAEASGRGADLMRLRTLMKSDLSQATARRARGPTGRAMPQPIMGALHAGDPVLTLTRAGWTNPGQAPRSSLQRVEYQLVGDRLERRTSDHVDGARADRVQVLYRGVRNLSVAFLRDGVEAPAYGATTDRPLPDAVRVTLTLEGLGEVEQLFLVGGGR